MVETTFEIKLSPEISALLDKLQKENERLRKLVITYQNQVSEYAAINEYLHNQLEEGKALNV